MNLEESDKDDDYILQVTNTFGEAKYIFEVNVKNNSTDGGNNGTDGGNGDDNGGDNGDDNGGDNGKPTKRDATGVAIIVVALLTVILLSVIFFIVYKKKQMHNETSPLSTLESRNQ